MNSRELISEALKYIDNGSKKYYLAPYNQKKVSSDTEIVTYTVRDIFGTASEITSDIYEGVKAIPATIDNISSSLTTLGYTALNSTLAYIKNAALTIEEVQKVVAIYRVARPLVERIVDIASIWMKFQNVAKVAQDVIQYITRLSIATARNLLNKLWNQFLDTTVFAIYLSADGTEIIDTNEGYEAAYNYAVEFMTDLLTDKTSYEEIIRAINDYISLHTKIASSDPLLTNELDALGNNIGNGTSAKVSEVFNSVPSFSLLSYILNENLTDVFFDYKTALLYVSTSKGIYKFDEEGEKKVVYENSNGPTITKVFIESDVVYFVESGNLNVDKVTNATSYQRVHAFASQIKDYVYTTPISLVVSNGTKDCFYSLSGTLLTTPAGSNSTTFVCSAYNYHSKEVYYVMNNSNNGQNLCILKRTGNSPYSYSITELVYSLTAFTVSSMGIVEGVLFADCVASGVHSVKRLNTEETFDIYTYPNTSANTAFKDVLFADDNFISNGRAVYSHSFSNNAISMTLKANAIPVDISSVAGFSTRNGVSVANIPNNNDFLIAAAGSSLAVTNVTTAGSENWVQKNFDPYKKSSGGDASLPDDLEAFVGCVIDGTVLYTFSQQRVYKITDLYTLLNGVLSEDDENLPATKASSVWVDDVYEEIFDMKYDTYYNAPEGSVITSLKKIGSTLCVGLYFSTDEPENYESCKTGIYSLINGTFTKLVPTCGVKPFSFDKLGNIYYYTNGKRIYRLYPNTLPKAITSETDENIANSIVSLSHSGDTLIAYLTNSEAREIETIKLEGFASLIKNSDAGVSLYSTPNSVILSDSSNIYNIFDSENIPGGVNNNDLFQLIYSKTGNTNYSITQSKNSVVIHENRLIYSVPYNSNIRSAKYHCGYYTDTLPHSWAGVAPYYFCSNVLNKNKEVDNKLSYLESIKQSFANEFERLIIATPDAFIAYARKKVYDAIIASNSITIEKADEATLNSVIKSAVDNCVDSFSLYITDRFAAKVGDDDTYQTFANAVYNVALEDSDNDITEAFYSVFKGFFYSTMEDVLMAFNALSTYGYDSTITTSTSGDGSSSGTTAGTTVALDLTPFESWLLHYYQIHKYEWAASITDFTTPDRVKKSVYSTPLISASYMVEKKTYKWDTSTSAFIYGFCANPSLEYDSEKIKKGYLYNGEFYSDSEHTTTISHDATFIYIDLLPTKYSVNFASEENTYHQVFYSALENVSTNLDTSGALENVKARAKAAIDLVTTTNIPSDAWKGIIADAVTTFYIPQQGNQYRTIVTKSNMYPINWEDVPEQIPKETFDTALTLILNQIKGIINRNISLLVDEGDVRCYSCIDAGSAINKIIDRNTNVKENQKRIIKSEIDKAKTIDEIYSAIDIVKIYIDSLSELNTILDAQSALYATYVEKIVKAAAIDNEEIEVTV